MADVTANINRSRAIIIAQRRVEGFAQQFGEAHRNLARHAAFPLVLTPDLLYQIWANFVPEAPWTAVAHVLLSRLCRQVGYEMYEMDISDRNLLLRELKEEFGQARFDELGEFLLDYVAQRLTDDDADTRDLREAQEWTALAYTKPDEVARELAHRLSERVQQEDMGEVLRLASLVETLAEPLVEAGFEPLLVYSQGIESVVRIFDTLFEKVLYQAIAETISQRIEDLKKSRGYKNFAQRFPEGLLLYYQKNMSLGEIAKLWEIPWSQARRIFQLENMIETIQYCTEEKLIEQISKLITTIQPEEFKNLAEEVRYYTGSKIFKEAQAEIMTTKKSKKSFFAQILCRYINDKLTTQGEKIIQRR